MLLLTNKSYLFRVCPLLLLLLLLLLLQRAHVADNLQFPLNLNATLIIIKPFPLTLPPRPDPGTLLLSLSVSLSLHSILINFSRVPAACQREWEVVGGGIPEVSPVYCRAGSIVHQLPSWPSQRARVLQFIKWYLVPFLLSLLLSFLIPCDRRRVFGPRRLFDLFFSSFNFLRAAFRGIFVRVT